MENLESGTKCTGEFEDQSLGRSTEALVDKPNKDSVPPTAHNAERSSTTAIQTTEPIPISRSRTGDTQKQNSDSFVRSGSLPTGGGHMRTQLSTSVDDLKPISPVINSPSATQEREPTMEVITPQGLESFNQHVLSSSPQRPPPADHSNPSVSITQQSTGETLGRIAPSSIADGSSASPASPFVDSRASAAQIPGVSLPRRSDRSERDSHGALDMVLMSFHGGSSNAINWKKVEEFYEDITGEPFDSPPEVKIPMQDRLQDRLTYYSAKTGELGAQNLRGLRWPEGDLESLLKQDCFWIDVADPTASEMNLFSLIFNIHPLTVEDILTEGTREKMELYKPYYFICYCAVDQDPDSFSFMQSFNVNILVFGNFVLSFHQYRLSSVGVVVKRLEQLKAYLEITPHWINYALLDDITDGYQPLIQSVEMEVDSIDDLVLIITKSEQSDMLRRIANARRRVMTLQRLLTAKSDVLRILMKRLDSMALGSSPNSPVDGSGNSTALLRDTVLYLGDVQDHAITMVQNLLNVDTTLNRSHSNYLAQINIELTASSNDANDAVAKLTGIASILVPLNVITGLWGMNVKVPGQDNSDSLWWFFGIIFAMICVTACGLWIVRWMGLINSSPKR